MDFQQQPNGYQPNPNYSYNMNQAPQRNYMDKRSTGLATASIALGIVSIVTFCCLYAVIKHEEAMWYLDYLHRTHIG